MAAIGNLARLILSGWILATSLAACGTTGPELRAGAREQDTFMIEMPRQTVHANVARAANQCYSGGTRVSHFYVRESVTGQSSSTVEVVQDGLAIRIVIAVDIKETPVGTNVTYFVHPRFAIFTTFKPVITGWANGTGTHCGAIT